MAVALLACTEPCEHKVVSCGVTSSGRFQFYSCLEIAKQEGFTCNRTSPDGQGVADFSCEKCP